MSASITCRWLMPPMTPAIQAARAAGVSATAVSSTALASVVDQCRVAAGSAWSASRRRVPSAARNHFTGRHAKPGSWPRILAAFEAIAQAVATRAQGRPIYLRGHAGLPTATALGATFLATRWLETAWLQHTIGRSDAAYCLAVPRQPSGFTVTTRDGHVSARDLAVLISVNHDVIPA